MLALRCHDLRRVLLPEGAAANALGLVPTALRRALADPFEGLKGFDLRLRARREDMDEWAGGVVGRLTAVTRDVLGRFGARLVGKGPEFRGLWAFRGL